jgi:hypothetical protein
MPSMSPDWARVMRIRNDGATPRCVGVRKLYRGDRIESSKRATATSRGGHEILTGSAFDVPYYYAPRLDTDELAPLRPGFRRRPAATEVAGEEDESRPVARQGKHLHRALDLQ